MGLGVVVIFALDKFVLRPRREQARAVGPFAAFLAQSKAGAVPVQEPEPVVVSTKSGGESPGQRRPVFDAPPPAPRRYFIGKGPVEDEKA